MISMLSPPAVVDFLRLGLPLKIVITQIPQDADLAFVCTASGSASVLWLGHQ